jgi:IS30 family transposase
MEGVAMGDTRVRGERLTREERLAVRRLISGGCSFEDAARAVRCSTKTVQRLLNAVGGMPPRAPRRATRQLSLAEREEVSRGLEGGDSYRAIARRLGRAPSTVCREVNGNGGPYRYRACWADEAAYTRARRPKATKFRRCPRLRAQVESLLHARWSPQQISARLGVDYPNDPEMRVSHETIYRSLFVQTRGVLRKELTACLRSGRTRRRSHGRKDPGGYIKGMVLIADRPAEVADRAVPGHWEGDLVLGVRGESAIATLVERQTRYVMLLAVGRDRTSARVCALIAKKIKTLPRHLAASLTWDRGKEMAGHREFSIATGVQVYFCDPHSPWQRGSNENTNGLLRQYFPRGTDLSVHSQRHLNRVAHLLNDRPRQTLGWMKPSEKLAELLQ